MYILLFFSQQTSLRKSVNFKLFQLQKQIINFQQNFIKKQIKKTIFQLMFTQFNSLWKIFIRPTRQEYNIQDLGMPTQIIGNYISKRTDIQIKNKKGLKIQASLYEPISINEKQNLKYSCIIYTHCNTGSRIESLDLLPYLIEQGLALFSFDFTGCGQSEGEYVTLGINESEDLECIIYYLKKNEKIQNIILWGRSMGAVTNFIYLSKNNSFKKFIKCLIFDSGFANLNQLVLDLAKQKTKIPSFLIDTALSFVKNQIKQKSNLDFNSLDLTKIIHDIYIPCYFICSKEDTFVKSLHIEELHARYNGQKWLLYAEGNHNAKRNPQIFKKLIYWISSILGDVKKEKSISIYEQASFNDDQNISKQFWNKNYNSFSIKESSINVESFQKNFQLKNKIQENENYQENKDQNYNRLQRILTQDFNKNKRFENQSQHTFQNCNNFQDKIENINNYLIDKKKIFKNNQNKNFNEKKGINKSQNNNYNFSNILYNSNQEYFGQIDNNNYSRVQRQFHI
ncbi:hypothetical protein IMG5_099930 [Ichthyophthirius multifiliis]|uniref:Serine aminopeptidase S33 domain-containing protein n=1 Tax=Ichthyophthirius multifiliis TaxID=5932 RepID=G0QS91_ICHMU|nr:hypothetical protein IMG5_099930 [Ichthyophthirius multifiliis]EGR31913.1 hypothetical protein IMG5_099930 [Ichthyophthirius multifiliis]|eukprot:XP_004035399.1 hypothetical protein IMG5_099930 [Ichthyophthirius multifiliis]